MATFYAMVAGKKYGPFDADKLKRLATAGKISRDDKISRDSETNWVVAGTVKGLFPATELIVPVAQTPVTQEKSGDVVLDALPAVGKGAILAGKATAVAAKKTGTLTIAGIMVAGRGIMVAGRAIGSTAKHLATKEPEPSAPPAIQPLPQAQPAPPPPLYAYAPPQPQHAYAPPQPQQIHIHNVVHQTTVVSGSGGRKSVLVAFLLAFLFGPLGMVYSTVFGAIVMFVLSLVVLPMTFGLGLLFTWPIGCIWAALAASRS